MEGTEGLSEKQQLEQALGQLGIRPIVMPVLIVANAAVFIAMAVSGVSLFAPATLDIVKWGGNFGPLTTSGEWWRLGSCVFVHIGLIHIAMNMAVLADAGRIVERLVGHAGFLAMYVVSGLLGSVASLLWNANVVSAGASGAVFGLFGCLLGLLVRDKRSVPELVRGRLGKLALVFVGYNVLFGMSAKGIDMAAHVGGLAGGFLCGLVLALPLSDATAARRKARAGIVAAAGVAAVGLLLLAVPKPSGPPPMMLDPDAKVSLGKSDVYYTDGATIGEAVKLKDFLVSVDYIAGNRAVTVVLSKPGDAYVMGLVIRSDVEIDTRIEQGMRAIGAAASLQAFDGTPVIIDLLDPNLVSRRRLDPVGAEGLEDQGQPAFLLGLELEALRAAPLYQRHEAAIRAAVDEALSADLGPACGWKLVGGLRSVLMRHYPEGPRGFLVVVRGMPRAALDECVAGFDADEVAIAHDGDYSLLTVGGVDVLLRWLDGDSFALEVDPEGLVPVPVTDRDRLSSRISARTGYDGNPELVTVAERVNTSAMWLAVLEPPGQAAITVGEGLDIDARFFFPNAKAANFTLDLIESLGKDGFSLPSVREVGEKFTFTNDAGQLSITARFTEQELVDAVATLAADEEFVKLLDE